MFNLYKNEMQQVRKPTNLWYKEAKKIDMAVSTLLGPYGMYKMTESGEILSNGKDVVDSIELGPMAEPILDAVSKQYEEFGDGTVSLALILSRLISKAYELSKGGMPMPTILSGYKKAMEIAAEVVKEETRKIGRGDIKDLEEVIKHSVAGSVADDEPIRSVIRDAILFLKEPKEKNIAILTEGGEEGAEVIIGLKLDYNRVRDDMPEKVYDAKIAVVDKIAPKKTNFDIKIDITGRKAYRALSEMERNQLREFVNKLVEMDVKAIFSKEEIDPRAAEMMAKKGIMGFEKINEGDMKTISESTGASKVNMLGISEKDLGFIGIIDDSKEEGCVGGVCRT